LPALSVQLPLWLAPVVSGPAYVRFALHEATPEVASVPLQVSSTPVRYQPWEFGGRPADTLVAGGVASILSVRVVMVVVPPSLVALQVLVVPVVGPSILTAGSHPLVEVICDSGSLTDQCRTM